MVRFSTELFPTTQPITDHIYPRLFDFAEADFQIAGMVGLVGNGFLAAGFRSHSAILKTLGWLACSLVFVTAWLSVSRITELALWRRWFAQRRWWVKAPAFLVLHAIPLVACYFLMGATTAFLDNLL